MLDEDLAFSNDAGSGGEMTIHEDDVDRLDHAMLAGDDNEPGRGSMTGSGRNSSGRSGDDEDDVFDINDNGIGHDDQASAMHSSPTTSHHSPSDSEGEDHDHDENISVLPDEVIPSSLVQMSSPSSRSLRQQRGTRSPYTPTKQIQQPSPFRHASSVRAMQMDMSPPLSDPQHPYAVSVTSSPRHSIQSRPPRLSNWSRQSSSTRTPRSAQAKRQQQQQISPVKRKDLPLVLLHVTLLPIRLPYSLELMSAVLPHYILENYKMLKDKVNETVLDRGILLPHPKEEYDLLEERLLESLELKVPRILKCGHFHAPDDGGDDIDSGRSSRLSSDTHHHSYEGEDGDDTNDADVCVDCGRHVRDGRLGVGQGLRRWNVKIYAANGLMRAGAWAAAWKEMERVDVEIEPWIPKEMRRELDSRKEQQEREDEEDEMTRSLEQESGEHESGLGSSPPPLSPPPSAIYLDEVENDHQHLAARPDPDDLQEARLREIYGEARPRLRHRPSPDNYGPSSRSNSRAEYGAGYPFDLPVTPRRDGMPRSGEGDLEPTPTRTNKHRHHRRADDEDVTWPQSKPTMTGSSSPRRQHQAGRRHQDEFKGYAPQRKHAEHEHQVPLSILLRNYLFELVQDRRNIAIAILSLIVLFLALPSSRFLLSSSMNNSVADPGRVFDVDQAVLPSLSVSDSDFESAAAMPLPPQDLNEGAQSPLVAEPHAQDHEGAEIPLVSVVTSTMTVTASAVPPADAVDDGTSTLVMPSSSISSSSSLLQVQSSSSSLASEISQSPLSSASADTYDQREIDSSALHSPPQTTSPSLSASLFTPASSSLSPLSRSPSSSISSSS